MVNAKTWNPAQIDQAIRRLEGIIRSGSYNPAELNQLLNQLGEPGYINTWNPAELDQKLRTLLYDLLSWKTTTGNPIQLRTNNGGLVQSCEVTFSPIQSGSGDPAPDNVRPISGWNSVVLNVSGINIWNEEWEVGGYNVSNGEKNINTDKIRCKNLIPIVPNTTYYKKSPSPGIYWNLYYDIDKNYLGYSGSVYNAVFTTPSNAYYMTFATESGYGTSYNKDISINFPSTNTNYNKSEGLTTHTATFSDTIYGGSYEFVSGKGKSEWAYIASYDGETITEPWISSIDAYVPETTPSTGAEVCYKLATPTEITLTPEEIELLTGDNVLWTDGDNIEITYKKLLLPSDVETLSKIKKIEEKPKTKRSKKKKEE